MSIQSSEPSGKKCFTYCGDDQCDCELSPRFSIDPFADVRLGRSLFEMQPEDWLVKKPGSGPRC
jgi:hypothetical protein